MREACKQTDYRLRKNKFDECEQIFLVDQNSFDKELYFDSF